MKKTALFFILFSGILTACGCRPAPPTQEWCEWALWQIPDNKPLSKVDSTAFSSDFYCLLKEVGRLSTWEYETYDFKPEGADCLYYWYDGMEGSIFDGGRATLSFTFTPVSRLAGEVTVTIDHPDYLYLDGTHISQHKISVIFEDDAWRINDWNTRKWRELAEALVFYQQFYGDRVIINSQAKAILDSYLEKNPLPEYQDYQITNVTNQ